LVGTKAVTITGGGEPLCHPNIDKIIRLFFDAGIEVGLVTNGLLLNRIRSVIDLLTWVRISWSDDREFSGQSTHCGLDIMENTDWAFSYVVTNKPNIDNIQQIIDYANENNFTHIRLVHDLINLAEAPNMDDIKRQLSNDDLVIYQPRKEYTRGAKKCWISLLKPVIAADLYIYPCCGVQYAVGNEKKFPENMRMGIVHSPIKADMEDRAESPALGKFDTATPAVSVRSLPFDGSKCIRCYYSGYNELLNNMSNIQHAAFV